VILEGILASIKRCLAAGAGSAQGQGGNNPMVEGWVSLFYEVLHIVLLCFSQLRLSPPQYRLNLFLLLDLA